MSSYFDDASLVMIPSGYKTSKVYSVKPTDGTGDLTFTRSNDTATRVASNGLIEKVRTNLILQSQAFNVTWTPVRSSVTANTTTAPDGTSTADTLFDSVDNNIHYVRQSFTAITGPATISIYAKANQLSQIQLVASGGTTPMGRGFNLSTGTTFAESVGGVSSNDLGQSITAVGNGWYRCTMSWTSTGQNDFWILTSSANAAAYAGTGTNGVFIWGAMLETSDIATPYIGPTTTAAVSVGPVANVPRLDYTNSTCPRLLLEPQRTNVCLWSEQFNNAAWSKSNTSVTANTATSPDGYQNADTYLADGVSALHNVASNSLSLTSATAYSFSVFAKKGTNNFIQLIMSSSIGGMFANFDLNTGTVGTLGTVSGSNPTASIVDYGNGWYRCIINFTATTTTSAFANIAIVTSASAARAEANTLATSVFLWGAQVELGAYATSYIPTLGAAVTRGADDMDTTFASAFATDGGATWFLEFDGNTIPSLNQTGANFALNFASGDYLGYNHNATPEHRFRVQASGSGYFAAASGLNANSPAKLAVSVTASSYTAYANGVEIGTASIVANWASATNLITTINDSFGSLGVKQMIFFPTALSNAQLAELTA